MFNIKNMDIAEKTTISTKHLTIPIQYVNTYTLGKTQVIE